MLGFDPDPLAERYRHKKDKGLRGDTESQFVEVTNDSSFANIDLDNDPYSEPVQRDQIRDQQEVIVICRGWVGMMTSTKNKNSLRSKLF
jgi:hypothetical protein|tara:strand:- start:100 stop:366 length:267 start_codon:yes stop_codon:yes gene_type:complete